MGIACGLVSKNRMVTLCIQCGLSYIHWCKLLFVLCYIVDLQAVELIRADTGNTVIWLSVPTPMLRLGNPILCCYNTLFIRHCTLIGRISPIWWSRKVFLGTIINQWDSKVPEDFLSTNLVLALCILLHLSWGNNCKYLRQSDACMERLFILYSRSSNLR